MGDKTSIDAFMRLFGEEKPSTNDPLHAARSLVRNLLARLRRYAKAVVAGNAEAIAKEGGSLSRASEAFAAESFLLVEATLPTLHRGSFQSAIASAQKSVAEFMRHISGTSIGSLSISRSEDALTHLLRLIEKAQSHTQNKRMVQHWVLRGLVLVSICAAAVATFYLGLQDGVEHVATEVLLPYSPLKTGSQGALSSAPEDLAEYFHEFSDYYFGHLPIFPAHFYPKPDVEQYKRRTESARHDDLSPTPPADRSAADEGSRRQRADIVLRQTAQVVHDAAEARADHIHRQLWRVILKNSSPYRSTFVGTIRIDLRLSRLLDFPWALLRCTPDLYASALSSPSFSLVNQGIGPALHVRWHLRTFDQLVLQHGEKWIIFKPPLDVPYLDPLFLDPAEKVNSWPVAVPKNNSSATTASPSADAEGGEFPPTGQDATTDAGSPDEVKLALPLFLRLPTAPEEGTADERFFLHEEKWYEVISTLERLAAITRAEYRTPAVLSLSYTSMSGKRYAQHFTHDLPENDVFYVRTENLLERDPRQETHLALEQSGGGGAEPSLALMAEAIALPPLQPKGVDLIVESLEPNVRGLAIGGSISKAVDVNQFLNPSGQIVLYMLVAEPVSARYEANVYINGGKAHHFAVDAFVPSVLQFPEDDASRLVEVDRFSNVVRRSTSKTPKPLNPPKSMHGVTHK